MRAVWVVPIPAAMTLFIALAAPASAGPIAVDTFYEFGFFDVGTQAVGCDPADPAGAFCTPSSGTPTTFLDAPPWTFTAAAAGATLTVTDAFISGDRFEVFDFGVSLGLTSLPVDGVDCGDDPVPCLADVNVSHASFLLGAGNHQITLFVEAGGFGAGYLRVQGDVAQPPPVPEPGTLFLVGWAMSITFRRLRRRSL